MGSKEWYNPRNTQISLKNRKMQELSSPLVHLMLFTFIVGIVLLIHGILAYLNLSIEKVVFDALVLYLLFEKMLL
ncbi:MAG TPA: hypothetical protein DCE78_02405 [Bacteroidetes bacterium]|nr:hypothetical protein [Bacteroidota bacterium]